MARQRPLLSVIVTTYSKDRLPDVFDLLQSLKDQTYSPIEIVFVGEGEPDLRTAVVDFIREQRIERALILRNDQESGVSAARNLGMKHAGGDIIAFVDDDAVPYPDWAEEIVETYLENANIIGVVGAAEPLWEEPSMNWFPKELYWIIGCTGWLGCETDKHQALNAPTVNVSYKREAFLLAGSFSNLLGPHRGDSPRKIRWAEGISEDTEFFLRVRRQTGKQVIYNPRVMVRHKIQKWKIGLRWVIRRSLGVGWSRHMLERSYGREDRSVAELQQGLLQRIFTKLLPNILKRMSRHPLIAWRQLLITVVALLFVGLGYLSFFLEHDPNTKSSHGASQPNSGGPQ